MNSRILLAAAFIVASPVALCRALAAEATTPGTASVKAVFVDPAAKEVAEIRSLGDTAINRLAFTLVNEINTAVSKGGYESAVEIAHLKSLPMTGDRVTGLPRIKTIKRTSLRLRNPANAPDAADQLALERVLKELASDFGPSKILIQKIEAPGAGPEWRVYRPLGAASVCLKCHGDPAEQSPALRAKLNSLYPVDQATGYRIGEWRGLLRVTVDAGPPPAPKAAPSAPPKKK